ncbi:protein of unknown function [Tistlia consotensis]|uniref:DUF4336 domain-containing protein n=1 Tax=Tistlia consotensis USBA 355 TaxID=560819 RepID=A0A1Y6BI33_9PROT|nr:DUF4336 domain-containing protein [Tistlia consotensis]SMF02387.1 protein of unknown function [Tistlia consotensis USBA 355]SNS26852.1 protein of unknown function [Tistlia consotensis]
MTTLAFEPYAPLDVPKPLAPELWVIDGPEIRFGYVGLKVPFPTRMTVVRLPDGGLWLHSPTHPSEPLLEQLAALGPVRFLVAPNSLHYWWLPAWAARFPGAEVHAAPGLARKAKRPLPAHATLGDAPPPAWAEVLDQVLVPGSLLTEVDFFHRPTRTLILTDLIENFEPRRIRSRFWRLAMQLAGAADPDGKAPYDMQLSFLGRRRRLRAAVERMIAWAPERIALAHGRCYEADGVAELRRAFRWVL